MGESCVNLGETERLWLGRELRAEEEEEEEVAGGIGKEYTRWCHLVATNHSKRRNQHFFGPTHMLLFISTVKFNHISLALPFSLPLPLALGLGLGLGLALVLELGPLF